MLVQILRKADSFGQKQENRLIEFPRKVRSLCKLCTTSISPSNNPMWHKVCGFFFIFQAIRFSVRSIRLFSVFDSTFDLIPDSASKTVKAWYRQSFHSKPPYIPAYRPGDPGVFHSRCPGFMDACHTPRSCSDFKFLEAHPIYIDYLISVNSKLN